MVVLKSPREIRRMRSSSLIVAEVLSELKPLILPGVTTYDLDRYAFEAAIKRRAKCAFKGYHGYPSSLCCSVNDRVVHGIPNKSFLNSGDIISLDFGVVFDDYFGDAAITEPVGDVSDESRRLIDVTQQSLLYAVEFAREGNRLGDISFAVQEYVERFGYAPVRDFVGHGIGRSLHEDPQVPNYGTRGKGIKLKAGMVLAIEPMINQYSYEVKTLEDGWTVVTCDGGLSAHFEHTVAITEAGPEILTQL